MVKIRYTMPPVARRPRFALVLLTLIVFVTLFVYYGSYSSILGGNSVQLVSTINPAKALVSSEAAKLKSDIRIADAIVTANTCVALRYAKTDISTVEQFAKFDFQPYWMRTKEFWDDSLEERYKNKKKEWHEPLKVFIVPHSHNDPGWLKTFEGYYHSQTRNILNHMVDKLTTLKNMTFIWSEISFFAQWWESAHPTKKRTVKRLLEEGRLEIVTGGWVMTDEATSHIYGMLDQLIEGHQWIKNNLGINIKTGWSVDPFGHGSTVPYLLKSSGITKGTVIQRIHYAWKQWFAQQMAGDFLWRQNWDGNGYTDMLVHNQPFDIYSIKHSCGPHPQICTYFDFRKILGEYNEYSLRSVPIDHQNVKQKADQLMEEYERTGSLFPHNVILVPLGDDFRYDQEIEWEQQYRNYRKLMDYINGHKEIYHADVQFGTPNDYFTEVHRRFSDFKTLKGDFFVYSDIFQEGKPAYWSGYFTTRPYFKILDRELERNLRVAEILYTFSLNTARRLQRNGTVKVQERNYEKLVRARQNLALFQHHDAITGTSKAYVMRDYGLKLVEGIQDAMFLQTYSVRSLLYKDFDKCQHCPNIITDMDTESYDSVSSKIRVTVDATRMIVVFNSFAQHRQEIVKLRISKPHVKVLDSNHQQLVHQINPVWNATSRVRRSFTDNDQPLEMSKTHYELVFLADLAPLSLNIFRIVPSNDTQSVATLYCNHCNDNHTFPTKKIQLGDIQLENHKIRALFDGKFGFLKSITRVETEIKTHCEMTVGAYQSTQFHSGAYLFMPDRTVEPFERNVLEEEYPNRQIVITSGTVYSEITVIHGNFFTHSARIYHKEGPYSEGIYIENVVDFDAPPKNREVELFMRFTSTISNGEPSVFYTDSNGLQMQKRQTVDKVGIEGNYFPITTAIFIEDKEKRLSLLVDHSQGGSSWQPGWIEVMLDRRTLYDDSRGMGEGLVDNRRITPRYWLLLEDVVGDSLELRRPTILSNYLSNSLTYSSNTYVIEPIDPKGEHPTEPVLNQVNLISSPLPCDIHLMNLRTNTDQVYAQFPSNSALLVLHRQGYSCNVSTRISIPKCSLEPSSHKLVFQPDTSLYDLSISSITKMTLTAMHKLASYKSLHEIGMSSMDLATFNITFSL